VYDECVGMNVGKDFVACVWLEEEEMRRRKWSGSSKFAAQLRNVLQAAWCVLHSWHVRTAIRAYIYA